MELGFLRETQKFPESRAAVGKIQESCTTRKLKGKKKKDGGPKGHRHQPARYPTGQSHTMSK